MISRRHGEEHGGKKRVLSDGFFLLSIWLLTIISK